MVAKGGTEDAVVEPDRVVAAETTQRTLKKTAADVRIAGDDLGGKRESKRKKEARGTNLVKCPGSRARLSSRRSWHRH